MRTLLLGGTAFIGRAVTEEALEQGLDVTLFSRGRTGAGLFPDTPRLRGDRDTGDYASLAGTGPWDAVVDLSGYTVHHVERTMDALGDHVGRYLFISSHAAYVQDPDLPAGNDEDTPLRPPNRDTRVQDQLDNDTYGPSKAACEQAVAARYGAARTTVVRPGKVAGPNDVQNTFTYWSRRAARGGRVAVPGRLDQPVQIIDVRDLAALVVRLLLDGRSGAYNAVGPAEPTTLGGLIRTCADVAGTTVDLVPVPADSVDAFFPLVRPESMWPTQQRSAARARAAGMPATPLATTAADVLAWDRAEGKPPLDRGFTPEEEAAVLKSAE